MACAGCRKPKEIRRPSINGRPSASIVSTPSTKSGSNNSSSGDQRSRITGLTYVPKR